MKSLKLVTLSYLQGESQVYVFHLLVEAGFLPFCKHIFFELHLVFSSCRVQDLEAVRCAGCSTRPIDIRFVFTTTKIKNLFNVKDAVAEGPRTRVVYTFSCASCNAFYVG